VLDHTHLIRSSSPLLLVYRVTGKQSRADHAKLSTASSMERFTSGFLSFPLIPTPVPPKKKKKFPLIAVTF
jgi:hypothetical protein